MRSRSITPRRAACSFSLGESVMRTNPCVHSICVHLRPLEDLLQGQ
ncbi:hypothetical protein ACU639_25515 [Streptomyces cynarae]